VKRDDGRPFFEEAEIRGEFDLDENGNSVILRGNDGHLYDLNDHRVNDQGYLINKNGSVLNGNTGEVVFYYYELDSEGEIPPLYTTARPRRHVVEQTSISPECKRMINEAL
jgi:hypothetical protein